MKERIKLYRYLTGDTPDRQEQAERWRLAGLLEKFSPPPDEKKRSPINQIRFPARGK